MSAPDDAANPYAAPIHSGASSAPPRSLGGVHPLRFTLAVFGCFVGSALLAILLAVSFWSGFYLLILMPAFAGITAAIGVFWGVRLGHCRNRWLGMSLGLACGCLIFLGYYYVDMVGRAGPQAWLRLDALPQYIAFRIQSDVSAPTDQPNFNDKPFWQLNLLTFCFEFGLILWLPAVAGLRAGSRAYDETRGRWGEAMHTTIGFGQSGLLKKAKQEGNLAGGLAAVERVAVQASRPHCMLVLEYLPSDTGEPAQAFLSGYELRMPGQVPVINELLFTKPMAFRHWPLSPEEFEVAMRLFRN
jgi:hypothetical protein